LHLETDHHQLEALAQARFDENEHFKQFLKKLPPDEVDYFVIAINKEVEAGIDCLACGKCCTRLMVNIDDAAITRLADRLQLTEAQFRERFVEGGSFMSFLNAIPCQFLDGKACTVYDIRPDECRNFPQLDRPGFTTRMFGTFSHYGMCPIIFNVVERLKTALDFRISDEQAPAPA
jgi:Fe-S-cluster containining protein